MRRFLLILSLCLFWSGVKSQSVTTLSLNDSVKRLSYVGYYNWGFIWIKAGSMDIYRKASTKYPGADCIMGVGRSSASWDSFFTVRDTLVSHYDPHTFLPYEFQRMAHEGNYNKTFDYVFDYNKKLVVGQIHKYGKYRRTDSVTLEKGTFDMLSVAWKCRNLDYDRLNVNDRIEIKVLIDSKVYDLYVKYLGIDKIKIESTKYECYIFSPLLVEGDVFKGGEGMKVWVSKDKNRIPMLIESKIMVGSVKAILSPSESEY